MDGDVLCADQHRPPFRGRPGGLAQQRAADAIAQQRGRERVGPNVAAQVHADRLGLRPLQAMDEQQLRSLRPDVLLQVGRARLRKADVQGQHRTRSPRARLGERAVATGADARVGVGAEMGGCAEEVALAAL